ncbi:hypothetical protein ACIQHZ_31610 [Streptomyces halstedii]|uniref:hypothetical protein n=1 Tax=Streptomyces halstedii TaxID=1944 RepID=UPI0037FC07F5
MKTFEELKSLSTEQLYIRRDELFELYESRELSENVRDAAAVIHNLYGTEIDARMMRMGK